MDEKQGSLTHFSGLIRVVVVVLIVLVLGFFFVGWASNRRAAVEVKNDSATKVSSESKTKESADTEGKSPASTEDAQIPSGIADSEATPDTPSPSRGPSAVPEVGMDINVLLTVSMLVVGTYLLHTNMRLKQSLLK